jgi:hypothetical protein
MNGKINTFNKNIFKYEENIKDIAKCVCCCCQRLHFKYQFFIVSKPYIQNFLDELKNGKNY